MPDWLHAKAGAVVFENTATGQTVTLPPRGAIPYDAAQHAALVASTPGALEVVTSPNDPTPATCWPRNVGPCGG